MELMRAKVKITVDGSLIIAIPEGELDSEGVINKLIEVEESATGLPSYSLVIDLRSCTTTMSKHDLWCVASALHLIRHGVCKKMALICILECSDLADFFCCMVLDFGHSARVFSSYEDAVRYASV
jgi:hypothetical protein